MAQSDMTSYWSVPKAVHVLIHLKCTDMYKNIYIPHLHKARHILAKIQKHVHTLVQRKGSPAFETPIWS